MKSFDTEAQVTISTSKTVLAKDEASARRKAAKLALAGHEPKFCKNWGDPDVPWTCLGAPDPQFTMDFADVELGVVIYWCAACGPWAHAMNNLINEAFAEREDFAEEFAEAVTKAERKRKGESS